MVGRSRLSVAGETRGTRPAREWRLQGSWPARRARSPPPYPLPIGFRRRQDPLPQAGTGTGGVELPRRLLWVAPTSLRRGAHRSQCAFCFGYREAGFGHGASLLPWARNGQERPAAGSGTRRVITFSPPGRAPRLPDSSPEQNLRAAFGFFLSFPRGAGDTIPFGDLLFTLSNNTHRPGV